ncbi:male sterility protein [Colletotrichum plurivorum]|uniref:Male sterility protein n=1 Tax=Colletotrichum plurivorum TaxID=2175906 RepID=A0A8H6KBB4_9PEZI|nr:male sterility protein [Colletotrichum plurivorum]
MAPIAIPSPEPSVATEMAVVDPMVYPSPTADERLKKLWNLHGHPHSSRFANPDLTSVAALIEHNASTQPLQAAFIYPVGSSFNVLNWARLQELCCKAASHYASELSKELGASNETGGQPTVALLGTGSSVDYLITQFALNRLRIRTLMLSNKNAPETTDHLLRVCNAVAIIVDKANETSLRGLQECRLPVAGLIGLAELERMDEFLRDPVTFESDDPWNLQAMIIHSSGSTGVPKPIIHTNRSLCQIGRMYRLLPEYFVENWYLCFPLFHVAGLSIALSGLPTGLPTSIPPEQWPPAPSSILSAWKALDALGYPADCLHCAPSVIDDLYEYISLTTNDFTPLINLKVLQPGGAPLSPTTLSKLQALGVNIKTTYGTTETGPPFRTIPHTKENPDVYRFRNLYPESPLVRMDPLGDGLFECVVYKGFPLAAELWLDEAAPNPYRTGDLFLEDPPDSGYFVLQGRRDDVLVHSNGEKTHASAVAMALEEEKGGVVVKTAVYGAGKPCPSVVVEVNWEEADARGHDFNLDDAVWQVVRACNEKLSKFSRIPRETILVLNRGESLPVTPKGNVRRNVAWEQYGRRVEELYDNFFGTQQQNADPIDTPFDEADQPTVEAITQVVADVFGLPVEEINEDKSWYDLGLDSLKAVELRSELVRSFGSFPLMFIFEYPTPTGLLGFLQRFKENSTGSDKDIVSQRHEWINACIRRMKHEIDGWSAPLSQASDSRTTAGEVVYLTGASGSLGNALLEVLVQLPTVKTVYCAVRGTDPQARVVSSLKSRGYPEHILSSDKIRAVSYDMADPKLGLDEQRYERLAGEVTVVMHNAWKLDFNQPVQQFEDDCLRGTMNLMSFCHKGASKKFTFMSSVAAAMGSANGTVIPELPLGPDPSNALPTGYAQSKFIVEQVAQHYASALGVSTRILRVGQLCGHSRLGTWNHTEMWPIMMMAGLNHLSAMPVLHTTVDWLPVDVCADTIRDVVFSPAADVSYDVTNLTNPGTTSWEEMLSCLEEASGKRLQRISMREWVDKLELLDSEGSGQETIPAMKLLGFFQGMAKGDANGEGVTFEAGKVAAGRPINTQAVRGWLDTWRQGGYLTAKP